MNSEDGLVTKTNEPTEENKHIDMDRFVMKRASIDKTSTDIGIYYYVIYEL